MAYVGTSFAYFSFRVKVRQTQQQRRTHAPKIEGSKYEYSKKEMEIIPGLQAKIYN